MTTDIQPDQSLSNLPQGNATQGTTLPRDILAQQGWPQALIDDYDAKGTLIATRGSQLQQVANATLNTQNSLRSTQQQSTALTDRVNNASNRVASLDTRLSSVEGILSQLTPQTGTQAPENAVTANRNGLYVRIDGMTTELYYNPTAGSNTGWTLISS